MKCRYYNGLLSSALKKKALFNTAPNIGASWTLTTSFRVCAIC